MHFSPTRVTVSWCSRFCVSLSVLFFVAGYAQANTPKVAPKAPTSRPAAKGPSSRPAQFQPPTTTPTSQLPFAHAVLLNGGQDAASNFYSHVLYLRMLRTVLQEYGLTDEEISIFASDGADPRPDQAISRSTKDDPYRWLFQRRREQRLYPRAPALINTKIGKVKLRPAKRQALRTHVYNLSQKHKQSKKPLFLFVTDHGTRDRRQKNNRNNKISMWQQSMSVNQLHRILRPWGKRKVVSVMSQCFAGSFMWSIFRKPGRIEMPQGDRCGFYATTPERMAYGCFPDTKLKKQVGHAYRFILAMREARTFDEAHQQVLLSDQTPDVPHRSSDGFLYALLSSDAKADGTPLHLHVDTLLKAHNEQNYAGLEQDQALLSKVARRFSLPRPVNFSALRAQGRQLQKRLRWWRRVERMWRDAFVVARNHHMNGWLRQQPQLQRLLRRILKMPRYKLRRWLKDKGAKQRGALKDTLSSLQRMLTDFAERQRLQRRRHARKRRNQRRREGVEAPPKRRGPLRFVFRSKRGRRSLRAQRRRRARARAAQRIPLTPSLVHKVAQQFRQGFIHYMETRPQLKARLSKLDQKRQQMHDHVFRLQVQKAALARMELLLTRIVARKWLAASKHPQLRLYHQGLQRVIACEGTPLHKEHKAPAKRFAPLAFDKGNIPLPSWFGISFRPLRKGEMPALPPGAVMVQNVYLKTPAAAAGLRTGDVITTVGGRPLQEPYEIRERVMLSRAGKAVPVIMFRRGKMQQRFIRFRRLNEPPPMKLPSLMGRTFADLTPLALIDGGTKLPSLSESTVLLFFWATWCGPCKAALPTMRRWKTRYKGLRTVTVSTERKAVLMKWLKRNASRMPFLNTRDPGGTLSQRFRVRATPTFILLKDGKIKAYQVGFTKVRAFESKIEKALSKPTAPPQ